ncbi:hypothetical protein MUK42_16610 [Musa troglodytarum]|uniref:Uncharacterized protein n=1 Tax=Musa troglodytarum TaxID=320322 RepID=A0A9E7HZT7_9LILI|nr:hypothetical protein MUK42_16610 [Musa troglodytarum]
METESDGSERESGGSLRFRDRVEAEGWHVRTGVAGAAHFCRGWGDDPERRRWRSHVPMADGVGPAWNPALRCTHVIGSGRWANRKGLASRWGIQVTHSACTAMKHSAVRSTVPPPSTNQMNGTYLSCSLGHKATMDLYLGALKGLWKRSGYHRLDGSQGRRRHGFWRIKIAPRRRVRNA